MAKNVGTLDSRIRIFSGIVIILLGIIMGSAWGLIGILPLVTGLFKWCPAYRIFNFSTIKTGKVIPG